VADADGSNDNVVAHRPGATFEAWPMWSPSGRYLLIERHGPDGVVAPVVVDLETGDEVVIDTTISFNGASKEWTPDESSILAVRTNEDGVDGPPEFWNVATGEVTPVPWGAEGLPTIQRTAP
jgi:Tol biopolymer transport system component